MPPTLEEEEDCQDDTIVVKGEYPPWSRPSSPDSMTPEIDVANLLAQINTPHNLDTPDALEEGNSIPNSQSQPLVPRPTPRSRQRLNVTTMEDRLMAMPELRPLPWRDGVEPGAENETGGESRRKQIRFGTLLATRGVVQEYPCNSCANGRGKFRVCVALDGYFKGACASCQLSGRPNRCSIKKSDDDSPTVNTPGGGAPENSTNIIQKQPQQQVPAAAPKAKRRKTDSVPEWESARLQGEQELGDSHARQQMNDRQRPWAPVNEHMNGINVIQTIPQEHRKSLGWAAVNQPVPVTTPQSYSNIPDTNGSYQQSKEQGRREDTFLNEDGSVALIDTLPKNKQRQVYGLISGLQNGIQGLQRELDSLKRALGIDED